MSPEILSMNKTTRMNLPNIIYIYLCIKYTTEKGQKFDILFQFKIEYAIISM